MKRLSIICVFVLFLCLLVSTAFADSFQFDFSSDQVWDNEWELSVGETVQVEIWHDGYNIITDLFGTSFYFKYDGTRVKVNEANSFCNDTNHGGPWDASWSTLANRGGGVYMLGVSHMSCVPVPDEKIKLVTLELECIGTGDSNITAAFDIGVSPVGSAMDCDDNDFSVSDAVATIHQIGGSEDEEETSTITTTIPITTSTIAQTSTIPIKKISDITMTTIPKTTRLATPDITMRAVDKTTTPPRTPNVSTDITETSSKRIEPPKSITKISPETTTTSLSSPYRVFISPSSVMLNSGETAKFSAHTISDGNEVKGTHTWEILPASSIGSIIDEHGLFTAGNNTADSNIYETVRVTDTSYENSSIAATITIALKKQPPVGCELSISPLSATILPGDTITFSAKNLGKRCREGSYEWRVNSKIGSRISANGIYTAGNNESGDSAIDIIIAKDTTNRIDTDVILTVLSKEKVTQAAPGSTQKPQQKTLSGKGTYSKVLIIFIALIILTGILLCWRIKRVRGIRN